MEDYKYKYEPVPGLVSVIIPTHNRSDLIIETLESFEKQSYDNLEIIVVDDHSSDNVSEIVESFARKSRFQVYFLHSLKYGGNSARNLGMINSRGSYIQFFDDDDIVNEDFITRRLESFNDEIGFVTCNFVYFKGNLNNIVEEKNISEIPHDILNHLYYTSLPTPCFLLRRETAEKIGFWNEDVKKLQDLSFFQRLFKNEISGIWLKDALFKVRRHDNNLSVRIDELIRLKTWEIVSDEWSEHKENNKVAVMCMCHMCFCVKKLCGEKKYFRALLGLMSIIFKRPFHFIKYMKLSKVGRIKDEQFIAKVRMI